MPETAKRVGTFLASRRIPGGCERPEKGEIAFSCLLKPQNNKFSLILKSNGYLKPIYLMDFWQWIKKSFSALLSSSTFPFPFAFFEWKWNYEFVLEDLLPLQSGRTKNQSWEWGRWKKLKGLKRINTGREAEGNSLQVFSVCCFCCQKNINLPTFSYKRLFLISFFAWISLCNAIKIIYTVYLYSYRLPSLSLSGIHSKILTPTRSIP